MKKSIAILFVCLLLSVVALKLFLNYTKQQLVREPLFPGVTGEIPELIDEKSTIGSRENPQARREYELAMLVDPATGQIPLDIKKRSYQFSARLPKRLRKAELRSGSTHSSTWRSIGPYNIGGRTRALAIDITNEDIILAGGVSGGMWRTEDGGKNWSKTTVPSSIHSVSCIVQDTRPGKTHIWYYGTGEFTSNSASKKNAPYRGDGVFKSLDGGKTWIQLESTVEGIPNMYNSQFQYVSKLIINPFNQEEDEVYLATVGAIFRSVDGGDAWDLVLGTKVTSSPDTDLNKAGISDYTDIEQAIDGTYYAVFSEAARTGSSPNRGVYRSTNGIQWTNITPQSWPRSYARTVVATSTTNPSEVYFSINGTIEELWKYTYFSGSGAQTYGLWTDLTENIPAFGGDVGDYDSQSSYNMVLEVHPDDGDIVFLGGTNLYRSADGFSSSFNTAWIGGYDTANNVKVFPNHFVDQHALAFYPSDPNKMLSSNDGGVFVTRNNTDELPTWLPLNNGFITTQFYTLGIDEFGSLGNVIGGLQDNGSLIANKPVDVSSWNNLLSGDGGYSAITRNSSFYYASFQFGKMYRFTLNNNLQTQTFARIDPLGGGGQDKLLFVNPYVLAPENQHVLYFAGGDVIWRNLNTSQIPLFLNEASSVNWEEMQATETGQSTISAISASYNPAGSVIYGTVDGRLFRINDASSTNYSVEEITSPVIQHGAYVSCITFDKRDSKNLIIALSNYNINSLFYSEDGGDTFQNISGNLEEFPDGSGSGPSVRWIEIVSKNDESSTYYAGTSTGVYSTDNLNGINTTWEQEGAEVIGNVLVTMIKYFSEDGTLVVATHGNGMYISRLENVWHTQINNVEKDLSFGNPYPNPFQNRVSIPFHIPSDGVVKARIYSALGQNIKTLIWASQFKGDNIITWDGTNDGGAPVISGTYFCRLEFEEQSIGTRIIYMP